MCGASTASSAATVGACVTPGAPGAGCADDEKPKCNGASVSYCYAGKPRAYYCKALGFSHCESGTSGVHCAM